MVSERIKQLGENFEKALENLVISTPGLTLTGAFSFTDQDSMHKYIGIRFEVKEYPGPYMLFLNGPIYIEGKAVGKLVLARYLDSEYDSRDHDERRVPLTLVEKLDELLCEAEKEHYPKFGDRHYWSPVELDESGVYSGTEKSDPTTYGGLEP